MHQFAAALNYLEKQGALVLQAAGRQLGYQIVRRLRADKIDVLDRHVS